jgi:hypothetical protein
VFELRRVIAALEVGGALNACIKEHMHPLLMKLICSERLITVELVIPLSPTAWQIFATNP